MKNAALAALEGFKKEYPQAFFRVVGLVVTPHPKAAYRATKEVGEAQVLAWKCVEDYNAKLKAFDWMLVIQENGPEECVCDCYCDKPFDKYSFIES